MIKVSHCAIYVVLEKYLITKRMLKFQVVMCLSLVPALYPVKHLWLFTFPITGNLRQYRAFGSFLVLSDASRAADHLSRPGGPDLPSNTCRASVAYAAAADQH